jgi:hypothetical protein
LQEEEIIERMQIGLAVVGSGRIARSNLAGYPIDMTSSD